MSNQYTALQRRYETEGPALWEKCYPRRYENLGNFYSPKIAATSLMHTVLQAMKGVSPGRVENHYLIGALLDAHLVPTFFVPTTMLRAAEKTNLPPEFRWTDIPMPFPALMFVFEHGAVTHPVKGGISFAAVARVEAGETFRHSWPDAPTGRTTNSGLFMKTGWHEQALGDGCFSIGDDMPTLTDIAERYDGETNLAPDSREWNRWLTVLCVKLVMVMSARPELVTMGQIVRTTKPKKSDKRPREFWSPNILGRHYEAQVDSEPGESAESGSKKRLHWRRGHFVRQAYGAGFSLRRTIWKEPMLIGSVSTAELCT